MSSSPCEWDGATHYAGCDCHEYAAAAKVKRLEEEVARQRAVVDEAFSAGWRAHSRQGLALTVEAARTHWRAMRGER